MRLRLKTQGVYTIPANYDQAIYSDMQLNTSNFRIYAEGYEGDAAGDIRKKTLFGGIGTWI
jgi:hypothetical protein